MRLCIQTNPLFTEEVIAAYRANPRVVEFFATPWVTGNVRKVDREFYESSITLIYRRGVDRPGDVAEDNPHSTWLAFASVFPDRRSAFDWASFTANEWARKFGENIAVYLPGCPADRTPEEIRNSGARNSRTRSFINTAVGRTNWVDPGRSFYINVGTNDVAVTPPAQGLSLQQARYSAFEAQYNASQIQNQSYLRGQFVGDSVFHPNNEGSTRIADLMFNDWIANPAQLADAANTIYVEAEQVGELEDIPF